MIFSLKPWLVCCFLSLSAGSITLSSSKYPSLLYPMWYNAFLTYGDTVYVLVKGSRPSQEPLQILEWKQDRVISIFQSTPRENLYKAYSLALSEDGERIYLGAYFGGATYYFDLAGKFGLAARDTALSGALFTYRGGLIRAAKDTEVPLKVLLGNTLPSLEHINKQLHKVPSHPVDGQINFNRTVLSREGRWLVLGYCLQDKVFVFDLEDGSLQKTINIRAPFPGYHRPPDTFPVRLGPDFNHRVLTWGSSFHTLHSLRLHKGNVYGLFREGYESLGVWVELGGSFRWDNDKQPAILMDITPQGYILGTTTGQDSDEVTWTLRRSSTLP